MNYIDKDVSRRMKHMKGEHWREEIPPERGGNHAMGFVTLVLTILIAVAGVVKKMDQRRQVARIDKEIAIVEKEMVRIRSHIKNQQTYLQSLKNSKVVDFARQMRMISPQPGQVCIINANDLARRDAVLASRRQRNNGTETAMNMPAIQR